MKAVMKQQYLTTNYKQRNHILFINLTQDNLFVEEYTSKFYHICTRCEYDDALVAIYRKGINFLISNKISANIYSLLSDIVQAAFQVEELFVKPMKRSDSSNHDGGVIEKSQNGTSPYNN